MITQKELSKELGISVGTVSLALNHSPLVNKKTAEKVLALARERGYRPNNLGRALQTGKSRLIGCVLSSLLPSFFNEVIEGMGRTCSANGYGFLVTWSKESSEHYVEQMLENRVAGVIFAGYTDSFRASAEYLQKMKINTFFCSTLKAPDFPHVVTDEPVGGRMGVEYLYRMGHRRFLVEEYDYAVRLNAALDFLRSKPDCSFELFRTPLEAIPLFHRNGATAAVCLSDESAVHLMGEFRSAGIRIPEELSLIGYDNLPMCDLPGIELTSVGQQRENIGIRSAEMAIAFAENRPYPRQIFLEPSIAERKTVKRIEVEKKDK